MQKCKDQNDIKENKNTSTKESDRLHSFDESKQENEENLVL